MICCAIQTLLLISSAAVLAQPEHSLRSTHVHTQFTPRPAQPTHATPNHTETPQAELCKGASAGDDGYILNITSGTSSSQLDQWETFLSTPFSASRPRLRWLHIPKCGSNFEATFSLYTCIKGAFNKTTERNLIGPSYPAPLGSEQCPFGVKFSGHRPIKNDEIPNVAGMLRHPRSRVASHCRAQLHDHKEKLKHGSVEHSAVYTRCLESNINGRSAVMARQIGGVSCGGAMGCNSDVKLKNLRPSDGIVEAALDRLRGGAVRFVGITEDWDASIHLFHRQMIPQVPVFESELEQQHKSVEGTTKELDLVRQELSYRKLSGNLTSKIIEDPDFIVFAFARQTFCDNFLKHLPGAKRPAVCRCSLPIIAGAPKEKQLAAARLLLETWAPRRAKSMIYEDLVSLVAGGPVLTHSKAALVDMY
mmetsp:Transcript_51905/g.103015  ORF Transcript_51905/g.103015 Transcript_51905/m.103015 type:complete len:420 (-) Transcript_51905:176-1435(-)